MLNRPLILLAPEPPGGKTAAVAPPAPSPVPAPAPAPGAAPTPAPEPAGDVNPFADLDAKFKAAGTEPPPPKPAAADPAKPAAAAPQPFPKPANAPPAPAPEPQRTPKELRAEKERLAGELQAAKTSQAALEAKIADYEKKGKDTEALRARLDARDKEFETLQGELRALKQEASPEFKKQYEAPFNQAADWAKEYVNRLTKADGTPANFDKDFVPLYRLAKDSTVGAARAKAEELFGATDAPEVVDSIKELVRLDKVRSTAFAEEKRGWAAKAKEEEGRTVQQREQFQDAWKRTNDDLQNTVPEYKDPVDDKELTELRQQGYSIVDAEPKSPREYIVKNAHIRQRVAAFGPNQMLLKRKDARIAQLEGELSKLKPRQPNPDPSKGGSPETAPAEKDWETSLKETVGI